jgi:5-methylcytosine-specific restriction enzyme A
VASKRKAAFDPGVRELILARSGGRCEMCGMFTDSGQFHHRNPRRMGGTRREPLGRASNAMYLHQSCHERVESNRHEAYVKGWLLYADDNPEEIRVKLWDGWSFLADDGTISPSQ